MESATDGERRLQLPGVGLPIGHKPDGPTFCSAVLGWSPQPSTVRERSMLAVMNALTDKPDWERKVFDDTVVARWRTEAVYAPPPLSSWSQWTFTTRQGFDDAMFDFCIAEIRDKATVYAEKRFVRVFDNAAAVAKSDVVVSASLRQELVRVAAELLEDGVPDAKKDWHPGSDGQVLDLVHPSLFPLVYGRSRILGNGCTLGLDDCLAAAGRGETVKRPWITKIWGSKKNVCRYWDKSLWSNHFQWLPCEVAFTEGKARISSYINNLHPVRQRALYPLVERVMDAAVPLWEEILGYTGTDCRPDTYLRMVHDDPCYIYGDNYYDEDDEDEDEDEDEDDEDEEEYDEEHYETNSRAARRQKLDSNRELLLPSPKPYAQDDKDNVFKQCKANIRQQGLQVIVKLANIHLTPDKPDYPGGSWHVEGMSNEWICATAIYYYDCDNVTESYLGFRQNADSEELVQGAEAQYDYGGIEYLYGVRQEKACAQNLGRVLTQEGRLIAFPNVLQHRVEPFSLQDRSRPGHRKILALFLVDPHQRIISTANVPPQRHDWWAEEVVNGRIGELPDELTEMITLSADDWPIGMEEAKELRQELMAERTNSIPEADMANVQITTRQAYRRTDDHTPGTPKVKLVTEDLPLPLSATSVLIKVHAVSLNYRDANIANGGNPWPVTPHGVPCNDAAGKVVAVGEAPIVDTENLTGRETARSWLAADEDGVLADYLVFDEKKICKLPAHLD
ncbi:hypothetical protein SLS58_005019 [Diplodia intermedia]|uniref:Enoyl reductase (ER) domain-containing protein n=1 Tax=Diplodia intermedia TaxID=856260 RepID=A0ABR3TRL0_9PEZI